MIEKALTDALEKALSTLRSREAIVLRQYFGLGDGAPCPWKKSVSDWG